MPDPEDTRTDEEVLEELIRKDEVHGWRGTGEVDRG